MISLEKEKIFALANEAIESGDCADLRCSAEKLNKLAVTADDKTETVDLLIRISESFATKGLYEQAIAVCEIAGDHASPKSAQETNIVMNILDYADKLPVPLQREMACILARRFADPDTPAWDAVHKKLGETRAEYFPPSSLTAFHL
ncbi:MAG: hypothetical protein WC464_02910 [Bdellovibrionales bacterium]